MKTQADCWKALLDGKTLEGEGFNIVRLENGCQVDENDNVYNTDGFRFCHPDKWKIQREHFDIKKAVELMKEKRIARERWLPGYYLTRNEFGLGPHSANKTITEYLEADDILADDYYIIEEGDND
jgi:hypothetical protein